MKHLTWLMSLTCFSLLFACSYPESDGFAQDRDGRSKSQRRISNLHADALKEYQKIFESIFTHCGDSYYVEHTYIYRTIGKKNSGINDIVFDENKVEIVRLKEVVFKAFSTPLSDADKLNGFQWRGTARISYPAQQMYEKDTGWSVWTDPTLSLLLDYFELKGEKKKRLPWQIPKTFDYEKDNEYFFQSEKFRKVTCSSIPQ